MVFLEAENDNSILLSVHDSKSLSTAERLANS